MKKGASKRAASEKTRGVATSLKVGKGVPPEATKWKPGQSGNPGGRPSEPRKVLVQAVKDMLAEVDPTLKKSMFERQVEQANRRALQGSIRHLELLWAYGLGKPIQQSMNVNCDVGAERFAALTDEELSARIGELQNAKVGPGIEPPQPPLVVQPAKQEPVKVPPEPPPVAPRALTPQELAKEESERVQAEAESFLRNDPITKLCGRGSTKPN